jgi:hypothetical protein
MSARDPLATVWDALDAQGFRPHGQPYDFRACCPGHGGDNPESLHVFIGADGRAVLYCFARHCTVEAILERLGLQVRDLFPAGHHKARYVSPHRARRADFTGPAAEVADLLCALSRLGDSWRAELTFDCPHCGAEYSRFVASSKHAPFMSGGGCSCSARTVAQALAGRVADLKGDPR